MISNQAITDSILVFIFMLGVIALWQGYRGVSKGYMYAFLKGKRAEKVFGRHAKLWGTIHIIVGLVFVSAVLFTVLSAMRS